MADDEAEKKQLEQEVVANKKFYEKLIADAQKLPEEDVQTWQSRQAQAIEELAKARAKARPVEDRARKLQRTSAA